MRTGTWHLISELSDPHGCMNGAAIEAAQAALARRRAAVAEWLAMKGRTAVGQ